jgi:hypothetical protein
VIAHAKDEVTPNGVTKRPPRSFLSTGNPYGISSLFAICDLATQCDRF